MVVQFPPADSPSRHGNGSPRAGRGDRSRSSGDADGLAPVTYLPGAEPSAGARRARAAVDAVARADAASSRTEEAPRLGSRNAGRDRATNRANNVAIHQLARRGMSRWELEQVLAKRDVDPGTIAAELDRLESIGLVDDAALAVTLVFSLHTRKGVGRAAIEAELRRRHLADDIVSDALAEVDDEDEQERADELAVARARQLTGLDYEVAARRLGGYLARKGYDGSVVRSAVRQALAGHPRGSHPSGGTVPPGSTVRFR
jgi:regulatory protein